MKNRVQFISIEEDEKDLIISFAIDMASIAFDVMMEIGILVDAVPFWMDEWQHPENFKNPALIKNIQQDGILL